VITNDGKGRVESETRRVLMNRPLRAETRFIDAETNEHLFTVSDGGVVIRPGDSYTIKYPEDGFEVTVS
jgi:hypothetical protein